MNAGDVIAIVIVAGCAFTGFLIFVLALCKAAALEPPKREWATHDDGPWSAKDVARMEDEWYAHDEEVYVWTRDDVRNFERVKCRLGAFGMGECEIVSSTTADHHGNDLDQIGSGDPTCPARPYDQGADHMLDPNPWTPED